MAGCSSDEVLVKLLDEQLGADERASVADHVEACASCQQRLKELAGDCSQLIGWEPFASAATTPWNLDAFSSQARQPVSDLAPLLGRERRERSPGERVSQVDFPGVPGYEILAVLGHGGMGVVYKARQEKLSRLVALKMIRAGSLARPEDLARFRIEAEAIAQLRHPNILQIFDIGEIAGLPYVALELLEGGSLDDRLGGVPQPARKSARLVATLAWAVHTAHQVGIVHRDLKPANVLFTREGTPKIADFGLAKRLERQGHTESGQVLGSPSYIPPEQAHGRSKEVRPAADVYALGAILYEMLTGRPPFRGTTPVETVLQVINDDPVPPSRLESQVPRDLETICLKCLAKEPSRRYTSAEALAQDLDRYLGDKPIVARRTPLWECGLKWARRRPAVTTLASFGLLAALAISIAGMNRYAHTRRDESRLAGKRHQIELDLTKARDDAMTGRFATAIESLSGLLSTIQAEPRLADLETRAIVLLEEARSHRALQQARQAAQDQYQSFLSRRDDALFLDTQLIDSDRSESLKVIRQSTRAALHVYAADSRGGEGWVMTALPASLSVQQSDEVARGCFEMLMVLAEAVAQPLPGESPIGQARAALTILESAARLRRQPTHAFHLRKAACLHRAGDAEGEKRELSAARRIEPSGAFDHFLSGLEQYKRGLAKEAKHHFEAALQAEPKHFWAQCLLAICDLNARPPEAAPAKAYLTACLQSHPDLAWLYLLRGFASSQLGAAATTPADAAERFEAALADYREALVRDPEGRFRYALLANRGLARFQSGKVEDAIADLKEAIALDPRQESALVTLAQIYRQEEKRDLAVEYLGRAIALAPDSAPLHRMRALWSLEHSPPAPSVRAAALRDLDAAIRHGSPGSRALAKDRAQRAHLLLLEKRSSDALVDCDAALQIDPNEPEANHWRVVALLELKRYDDVIDTCDRHLRAGHPAVDLLELRGLARSRRNDFASAIEDFTLALAQEPRSSSLHARRGWAYLVSGAHKLAQLDFEEAIRLEPSSADGYSGRGSALVARGFYREAVKDAEESLRHEEPAPRILYNAARIFAQSAERASRDATQRGRADIASVHRYQDRAIALLGQALKLTPADERATFWREVVLSDHACTAIRRLPEYVRWAAEFSPTVR